LLEYEKGHENSSIEEENISSDSLRQCCLQRCRSRLLTPHWLKAARWMYFGSFPVEFRQPLGSLQTASQQPYSIPQEAFMQPACRRRRERTSVREGDWWLRTWKRN
jgi:hypothetical protein